MGKRELRGLPPPRPPNRERAPGRKEAAYDGDQQPP